MPSLSVALVVHREQGWLQECAGSILDQAPEGREVELIAIDDASPDHAPALLDELSEHDARMRVRHLRAPVGRGEARNIALEMAEGDYVWFVQTTDLLAPGAIAAALERLRDTEPDVLLTRESRVDAIGQATPGPRDSIVASLARDGAVTLDQRPALAYAAPTTFNKVLRRGFLRDLGLRFESGGHGELPVTWPALLTADRIAAAPGAEYIRRAPPNAIVEGSAFDVFERYDGVFEVADARAVPSERRRLVLPAMLLHELAILRRVPAEEREAFFRRMSESYSRHRRGDEPPGPGRLWPVRERLVERGSFGAFRRLEQSLGLRGALNRRRRAAVRRVRSAASPRRKLLARYRARLEEPIDPNLAVFAAYWYRGYSCNPRAIYEKAREIVPGMRGVWVVREDAASSMPAGVEYVIADTAEYYDLIARAGYFVNNVNFPNHLVKREGAVHVMTHHGTPLKRMGLDLRSTPDGETRIDYAGLLRRCARWDFSITQNAFTTLIWERTYPTPYESLEVGYPRNDVLANATEEDVRRIRDELGVRPGQRVVFYAPTHREYRPDYVPALDLAAVADRLGPDFVVMARLHYLHEADQHLRELRGEGRVRDVAAHPSVEELCLAADVLVTDYSSIMFDYAVLDRPIVIHAPDWEEYRAMRGTYFDITAEPPGVVTATQAEVTEAFVSGAVWGEDAHRARAAFRTRFCALDDGRAAERVVRRVWLGEPASAVSPAAAVAG